MLPKHSKHCVGPTSDKLGISPQLVEDAVAFYYRTVRRSLVNLDFFTIHVESIGAFSIKKKRLIELIGKYENYLASAKPTTDNQRKAYLEVTVRLKRLRHLEELMKEEKERRNDFIACKKNGFR